MKSASSISPVWIVLGSLLLLAGCNRAPEICTQSAAMDVLSSLILSGEPGNAGKAKALLDISNVSGDAAGNCSADFSVRPDSITRLRRAVPQYDQALPTIARKFGLSDAEIGAGVNSGHAEYHVETDTTNGQVNVTMSTFSVARAHLYSVYANLLANPPNPEPRVGNWASKCGNSNDSSTGTCWLENWAVDRSGALQAGISVSDQHGMLSATLNLPADTDAQKVLVLRASNSSPVSLHSMNCTELRCTTTVDIGSDQSNQPPTSVKGWGANGRQFEISISPTAYATGVNRLRSQLAGSVAANASTTEPTTGVAESDEDFQPLFARHPSSPVYQGTYRLPDFRARDREFSIYRMAISKGARVARISPAPTRSFRLVAGRDAHSCSWLTSLPERLTTFLLAASRSRTLI